jgi:hypothetical protein
VAFELYCTYARVSTPGVASVRVWHEMGRVAARGHAEEVYRHVVRAGDTTSILCNAAIALFQSQHDTGKLKCELIEKGKVSVELEGFGAMCSEWSHMIAGYLRGLAEATSARDIDVRTEETNCSKGRAAYRVSWREAELPSAVS